MSSSEDDLDHCPRHTNRHTLYEINNSKNSQPALIEMNLRDCVPSTSTVLHERCPPFPGDVDCADIRNMFFIKNSKRNTPAPSEEFLTGVNCAIIGLLREIEENHKSCTKKGTQ